MGSLIAFSAIALASKIITIEENTIFWYSIRATGSSSTSFFFAPNPSSSSSEDSSSSSDGSGVASSLYWKPEGYYTFHCSTFQPSLYTLPWLPLLLLSASDISLSSLFLYAWLLRPSVSPIQDYLFIRYFSGWIISKLIKLQGALQRFQNLLNYRVLYKDCQKLWAPFLA